MSKESVFVSTTDPLHANYPENKNSQDDNDYALVTVDKKMKSTDPSSWPEDVKKKIILSLHGTDELPMGWEKLFLREDPHRTCEWCYEVKPRNKYPDHQWYNIDTTKSYCMECCVAPE